MEAVGEIHLAGHAVRDVEGNKLLIDDHGSVVCDEVWDLYQTAVAKAGRVATLVEWDSNVPNFQVLLTEAEKAASLLNAVDESPMQVRHA